MSIERIRELQQTMPFQPFEIETVGGKRIPVLHTDTIMFSEGKQWIGVFVGERFHIFEAKDVASVCVTPKARTDKAA
jgi:hypothetical protein